MRLVGGYLESLGPRYLEAGAMLGASAWRNFFRLSLPLAAPAISAAAALTFIFCFSSFGIILLLSPKASFATLEVEIYRQSSQLLALDRAVSLAMCGNCCY
ncbi:MAG: ABC transporter permease subunit [Deinococcales bacterium]